MHYREAPPPPALAPWVHRFWTLEGGDGLTQPVVPDGRPEIVIHVATPFCVARDSRWETQAAVLVSGQLTGPLLLRSSRDAQVFGIRFTASGASVLLRESMARLIDQVRPLDEVRAPLAVDLRNAIQPGRSFHDRIAHVSAILWRHIGERRDHMVEYAVRQLEGGAEVRELGPACGTTARTVQRRFKDHVGLSPSLFAQVVRFRRAYRLLAQDRAPSSTAVAYQMGYYDQAHLVREFRRFAGSSPGRFFHTETALSDSFLMLDHDTIAR